MDTINQMYTHSPYNLDKKLTNTHKHLINALYRLVEKYPFDSLTVKQICDEANVSRSNFYNHFDDKYHLLLFYLKQVYQALANKIDVSHENMLFYDFLFYIQDHGAFFKSLLTHEIGSELQHLLNAVVQKDIEKFFAFKLGIPALPKNKITELKIIFLTGGVTDTLKWWVLNDFPLAIDVISQTLNEMININHESVI